MGFDAGQARDLIVRPPLLHLDACGVVPYSRVAEDLLMGTMAQETHLGTYLRQLGGGPALGPYQMEPATHDDLWIHYIPRRDALCDALKAFAVGWPRPSADELVWNLAYATLMARIYYLRIPAPLPASSDPQALATYWKIYWNTALGRGTVDEFIENWNRYVV